jgi:hypothetical protein
VNWFTNGNPIYFDLFAYPREYLQWPPSMTSIPNLTSLNEWPFHNIVLVDTTLSLLYIGPIGMPWIQCHFIDEIKFESLKKWKPNVSLLSWGPPNFEEEFHIFETLVKKWCKMHNVDVMILTIILLVCKHNCTSRYLDYFIHDICIP